jgi:hypothetical protein
MRRFSAGVSLGLLALIAIGAAEASLLAMLVLFSAILRLSLGVELGPAGVAFGHNVCCPSVQVTLFNAATVGSFLLTTSAGLGAAVWKFRRWKPNP